MAGSSCSPDRSDGDGCERRQRRGDSSASGSRVRAAGPLPMCRVHPAFDGDTGPVISHDLRPGDRFRVMFIYITEWPASAPSGEP